MIDNSREKEMVERGKGEEVKYTAFTYNGYAYAFALGARCAWVQGYWVCLGARSGYWVEGLGMSLTEFV